MRSLKHLKPQTKKNVEEKTQRLVRCYSEAMHQQMDAGTQTDPVVVLSLAQAAVLGLISQNEVFGATIAPNGFYTGDPKESPAPPGERLDYEYSDQLIGANGDYLGENLGEDGHMHSSCAERRWQGPHESAKPPGGHSDTGSLVKGEAVTPGLPSCTHMLNNIVPREGPPMIDHSNYRVAHKHQPNNCCSLCVREIKSTHTPADTHSHHHTHMPHEPPAHERGHTGTHQKSGVEEDAEEEEDGRSNIAKGGREEEISSYFQASEVGYDGGEMGGAGDFDESSQGMFWGEHVEGEGPPGRRIDRLDINIQINESYCVDVGEGLKRWKCRMCEKSYTSKYNLVTHILGHNGIKPHACPHCGKLFKQPSHLQTHLLTHQGTRPHKCTVCKKGFTQTSHLKRHMLQHTDVKPYSCRFCRRGFAYPSELRAHEIKHERGRCHVCSQCGMEFPTYAHLKRHQVSHQGPSTFQCGQCNKSFAYRSQLQNHLLKHQTQRSYSCSQCGLQFLQLHQLRQHALTHKVLKPQARAAKGMKGFKCDVCAREFTLSANLKRHMLIHASVRPFQCHVCFKSFVQKQTLKTHMIVHLPVKPFKCKVCGKSFNRMYNLLGHMHLHAGSKPFKCPYCSSKFNLKGNLSRHMKVKHGMDVSPDGQDAPPDLEHQEDYEEENFDFSAPENLDNNDAPNLTKLSEVAIQELDYYNFGKDVGSYNTA
ncbi:zinc finger protein 710 [Chanos chanos]|uniref:Zinc finger protein 710 n=1 Tax=Chanos chanos TaxID=29144 RepID=A0A6J2UTW7_CHACN|nr:zinc finger protein 710-like [Chanos chanos]